MRKQVRKEMRMEVGMEREKEGQEVGESAYFYEEGLIGAGLFLETHYPSNFLALCHFAP